MKPDIKRLLAIADMLDTLPAKQLDMGAWRSECGTVFCAIGHAINKGILPDLTFVQWKAGTTITTLSSESRPPVQGGFGYVGLALGLSINGVADLFSPKAGETPAEVATTIRTFCEGYSHE